MHVGRFDLCHHTRSLGQGVQNLAPAGGPDRSGPPVSGSFQRACLRRIARRTLSFFSIRVVDARTSAAGSLSPPMKALAGLATMNA